MKGCINEKKIPVLSFPTDKEFWKGFADYVRFYVEGTHPPILTSEEFDRVQEEISRRSAIGSVKCN